MIFHSILFNWDDLQKETAEQPAYFSDLNLDQVVNAITAKKQEYNLKPFFYSPLQDAGTVRYRQDVLQDLGDGVLLANMKTFAEKMVLLRRYLAMAEKLDYNHHKKGWFLEAAIVYCEAVSELTKNMLAAPVKSSGFLGLREYLTSYVQTEDFKILSAETHKVKTALAGVKYSLIIKDNTVKVRKYEEESDYSLEVEKTFEKFKQGAVEDYRSVIKDTPGMNHVGAQILEFVALLHPEPFAALDRFCERHAQFVAETLRVFEREIQFYIAFLDYIDHFKDKGLTFCSPQIDENREVFVSEGFDIALAGTLLFTQTPVICNDFVLHDPERVLVVTGPNQGGKTTFARTFGQLHYLASLGCLVPGRQARLHLFDQIFTHFEREEEIHNLAGKLQDDLLRIHAITEQATPESILILNEIFSSTALKDAVFLSRQIMARVLELDLRCVWVTFMDEMASINEKTVSMVSTVVPENPAERTFKIIRKPADGLAYAHSLAEKHALNYEQIKERIRS